MDTIWKVYTDGGARGNPGPAACGVVILHCQGNKCQTIVEINKFIGQATNNQAEYRALLIAIEELIKLKADNEVLFHLDSQLVVEQMKGNYKVKNQELANLRLSIFDLLSRIGQKYHFINIPREKNKQADKLVNQVLDENSN